MKKKAYVKCSIQIMTIVHEYDLLAGSPPTHPGEDLGTIVEPGTPDNNDTEIDNWE